MKNHKLFNTTFTVLLTVQRSPIMSHCTVTFINLTNCHWPIWRAFMNKPIGSRGYLTVYRMYKVFQNSCNLKNNFTFRNVWKKKILTNNMLSDDGFTMNIKRNFTRKQHMLITTSKIFRPRKNQCNSQALHSATLPGTI